MIKLEILCGDKVDYKTLVQRVRVQTTVPFLYTNVPPHIQIKFSGFAGFCYFKKLEGYKPDFVVV